MTVGAAGDPRLDPAIDAWMAAGADRGVAADLVKETPIAKVFLVGEAAFKLKKPVDFGFVNYATLARRRWAVERELSLNRRAAGDIYRRALAIVHDGASFAFVDPDATEAPLEYALEMRRFDEAAILAHAPEQVDGAFAERLGRDVAAWHAAAPARPEGGGTGALGYTITSNAEQLRHLAAVLGAPEVEALIAQTSARFEALAPLLESRRAAGFARQCHGDLHLANIVAEHGRATPFDCIEFNDRLSEIDVLYDVGFLVMDLVFRGRAAAANRVLNGWLDEVARVESGGGVQAGLEALPLFLATRAAVRAHVSGHADAPLGRRYLAAAQRHLQPAPPVLAAVGGRSGTGKTTVARALAPNLGRSPGAVVLRSDEVRKRLWGQGPLDRLPPQAYAAAQSERVYGAMLEEAQGYLSAGQAVVLDAVFLRPQEREAAAALAARLGVAFAAAWLEAPPAVLSARVAARVGDASDADVAVLETQLTQEEGAMAWPRLDAAQPAELIAARIRAELS